jgi:transposase
MERIPREIYTQEFLKQAVRLHEVEGLTAPEVAKRLSLPPGTLKNWGYAARQGKLGAVGKNQKPLPDLEMDLSRLKRELAEVRMERALLKNAPYGAPGSFGIETGGYPQSWVGCLQ